MGVSLTNDGKVNFAAALHTREECGVLLYLHAAGKPVRIPFTEKNRIGNIYCMQAEGLADTKFQYNFLCGRGDYNRSLCGRHIRERALGPSDGSKAPRRLQQAYL